MSANPNPKPIIHGEPRAARLQEARERAILASLDSEEDSSSVDLNDLADLVILRLETVCRDDRRAEEEA